MCLILCFILKFSPKCSRKGLHCLSDFLFTKIPMIPTSVFQKWKYHRMDTDRATDTDTDTDYLSVPIVVLVDEHLNSLILILVVVWILVGFVVSCSPIFDK